MLLLCLFRKIDISTATLTYDVDNLAKHQFEIMSEGKVTSVQASSNEVMIYWLTTLQVGVASGRCGPTLIEVGLGR